jgi:BirA family transcriptional regulator, biotin operon repressor / biotin---[acetyl-CoA-carboxylase] ligase
MTFDLEEIRRRLPDRRIEWFDTIDSTMIAAAKLARASCSSGVIVGAEEQTAGMGRQGRSWRSDKGAGLYVSIILRLALGARDLPVVMLALGIAAREAIAEVTSLSPDLRWPNDVLIGGRKCAGILAQLEGTAVIAGIGINVSHSDFPVELNATSLKMEGSGVRREEVLVALAHAVDRCCTILAVEGSGAIVRIFEASSSYARGRRVRVEQSGGTIEGTTAGLDASGFLILRNDDGAEVTVLAGGVRPCS